MQRMVANRDPRSVAVYRQRLGGLTSLLPVVSFMLVVSFGTVGCTTTGLAFRKDDRLRLYDLPDRVEITVPHDIHWTFAGTLAPPSSEGAGDATAFAVLIDWTPPPPGRTLESLLSSDPVCRGPLGCPDGYLARNRIYVTTDTSFTIDNVATGSSRTERRTYHELTVVLVDAQGRRVGETAAWSRFRIPGVGT
jgi:hypothetical protein